MLSTLDSGQVASKQAALESAKHALDSNGRHPCPLIGAGVRSLFYAEMTTSPAETCGAALPRSGRFSRIQFAAALFDSFAPASSS